MTLLIVFGAIAVTLGGLRLVAWILKREENGPRHARHRGDDTGFADSPPGRADTTPSPLPGRPATSLYRAPVPPSWQQALRHGLPVFPGVPRVSESAGDEAPGPVSPSRPDMEDGHDAPVPAPGPGTALITHKDTALWQGTGEIAHDEYRPAQAWHPPRKRPARAWYPATDPARLTAAVLAETIRRAIDARKWPDLQPGHGYADSPGAFTAIAGPLYDSDPFAPAAPREWHAQMEVDA